MIKSSFLAGIALVAAPAVATNLVSTATFASAPGASVYGPGQGALPPIANRLGPDEIKYDFGPQFEHCLAVCVSAQLGARLDANFGLEYAAQIDSGSFDARYPIHVRIDAPVAAQEMPIAGRAFTIHTAYDVAGFQTPADRIADYQAPQTVQLVGNSILQYLNAPVTAGPPPPPPVLASLQVHSPSITAHVDLDASYTAFAGANVCVAGFCEGPAIGPFAADVSQKPLVAIDRTGAQAFGNRYNFGEDFSDPSGFITGHLGVPNIDAVAHLFNGTSTKNDLVSTGRGNIVAVNANVSGLIAQTVAIPLDGKIGYLSYHLLNVDAGLALDLRQTISLAVTPMETFDFTGQVEQWLPNGTWGTPTTRVMIPLGGDLTVRSNDSSLGVLPTTTLAATLTNVTELVLSGDVHIKALSGRFDLPDPFPGVSFGPAYNSGDFSFDLVPIPLYSNSFGVDLGTVVGQPFTIAQDGLISAVSPGYSLLSLLGDQVAGHSGIYSTRVVAIDRSHQCQPFVRLNPCLLLPFAAGSPVAIDDSGQAAFLGDPGALTLAAMTPAPVGSDSDELRRLLATGYGAVPEPAAWSMLIAGIGATGAAMRRRRTAGVTPAPAAAAA